MRVCDRIQADFDGLVLVAAGAPIPATDLAQQAGLAELENLTCERARDGGHTQPTKPLARSR